MLATSHFVLTTGILIAAQKAGIILTKEIIWGTYVMGTLIDLDHLVVYPQKSLQAIRQFINKGCQKRGLSEEYNLHSFLQEPWFVLIVLLFVSVVYVLFNQIGIFLLPLALALHVLMDILMQFKNYLLYPLSRKGFRGFIPSNTTLEYLISVPLAGLLVYLIIVGQIF